MSKTKLRYHKEYAKLFSFTRPHLRRLIAAIFCMFVSTIFDGVSIGMVVPLSDKILSNGKIIAPTALPSLLENWIARLNAMSQMTLLRGMAVSIVILFIFKGLFSFMQTYLMSDVGQRVMRDIRARLYEKFQDLDLGYFSRRRSGELMARITNDVLLVENAVSYGVTDLVYEGFQVIFFSVVILFVYWRLAFVALIMIPFISIPIVVVGKKLRKLSKGAQEKVADINSLLYETISGVRIVRAFGAEAYEVKRFREQNQQYYKLNMKAIKRTRLLGPATELVGVIGGAAILFYIGRQVINGVLSFGMFGLFFGSVMMMIKPFKKLSNVNAIMQKAFAASSRIYDVLETESKIKEEPDAWEMVSMEKGVEFRDVWFRYGETDVLRGVNLKCRVGEIVAIVGVSGAGKSTLVDLIPRFYDPSEGSVLVDGRDLRSFKIGSLRAQIGVVTQETILFNDTVKGNIAYGRREASYDAIVEAAKKAFAHEFILGFPQGYDTTIGDRGVKLSGGERQRLAIARAILKNPPLLILDEATSQLDSQSERLVQQALDVLMKGRTVFVIAHRLSTIKHATRIVVLDEGRIKEEGSHEGLLVSSGLYRRLYEMQFQP